MKRSYILCLSMYDVSVDTRRQRIKQYIVFFVLAQYYWCCKKLLRFNCRNKNDIDNDVDNIGINKHFFLIKRSHLMYLDFLIKLSYDVFTSFKRLNSIIEKVKILLCFHTLQEFFFFFSNKISE